MKAQGPKEKAGIAGFFFTTRTAASAAPRHANESAKVQAADWRLAALLLRCPGLLDLHILT
jgi:hypothetical protein